MVKRILAAALLITLLFIASCAVFTANNLTDDDLTTLIQCSEPSDAQTYKELRKAGYNKTEAIRLINSLYTVHKMKGK